MASTAAQAEAAPPSPATCQNNFERGVACALHLWPALTQAVKEQWGGPNSEDIRDWFAGAIVELFPDLSSPSRQNGRNNNGGSVTTTATAGQGGEEEPEQYDVEYRLLQIMMDEFEINVDDGSALDVAEEIMRARGECLRGKFDAVAELQRRFEARDGSAKVVFVRGKDQDEDTDWDTDEDGEDEDAEDDDDDNNKADVEMGDAPALVSAPKEKEAPEVDEDGFTKVTRKKR